MSIEISVIIPVYNGRKYLPQLFDMLQSQLYKNFEVIFVDDGSTDGSVQIIQKHTAIIETVLVRQENQGQGFARNTGIDCARGKYIVFIDQDDRISLDYLLKLHFAAERSGAVMASSGYMLVTNEGKIKKTIYLPDNEWAKYICITPWAKIYSTKFLKDENIRFLPLPLGEDIYFNILIYSKLYIHGLNICILQKYAGYGWTDNKRSFSRTTHRKITKETDINLLFHYLAEIDVDSGFWEQPDIKYFLLKTAVFHILYTARDNPIKVVIKYKKKVMSKLLDYIPDLYHNPLLKIGQPKGEHLIVRIITKGYITLHRGRIDTVFLVLLNLAYKLYCFFYFVMSLL